MVKKGNNVIVKEGVILGENVVLEDDVFIDYNCIIRDNVTLKKGTMVGANCILGEYQMDFFKTRNPGKHPLVIGENAIIRSGTIIYGDSTIGDHFQTGHNVTIREKAKIGNHVSFGTLSDIQGDCEIGNYVRAHSNVHIGQKSVIDDFVWIFPYTVLMNDPTPPSEVMLGVHIESFAIVATGSLLLPGVTVEKDTLIAAGSVVIKDVKETSIVGGNPAKVISDISKIKNRFTGEKVYPWRYTFKRGMPWEDSDYDTWYAQIEKQLKI
ncbi:acyltransferase [Anaerosacchariphilus polymeriproducens]|uniref:N-acetyltransferase n=1 Tax=Anaerosacchariphilus polymeriproducens TaxID=1812858 RepID=A0A371ARM5_9FIRM|nr:acyltransferase [Anaerosacchariphilus polymeriproducens]RDU22120.1 N-acetyltransferase [Anaerosacchariphilus polymeriproducens]